MKNVSVINAACRSRDAIGEAVHETCRAIAESTEFSARLFTFYSDATDVDTSIIHSCAEILVDPFFLSSDAMIIHFGFYTPLMNALLGGRAEMARIVRYHNITPKEFVDPKSHDLIDMSRAQIPLCDAASVIWADSPFNRDDLVNSGISGDKIVESPLFVKSKIKSTSIFEKTNTDTVKCLYVGRFVNSKGVLDLLQCAIELRNRRKFKIYLIGALTYSDPQYIKQIKDYIRFNDMDDVIEFVGEVSDEELANFYAQAHLIIIPSYHEGFCVPLAEGLRAGMIPIAYASGNIPYMIGGVGHLVPTGNIEHLGQAISKALEWLHLSRTNHSPPPISIGTEVLEPSDYAKRVEARAATFDVKRFRERIIMDLQDVLTQSD